MNWQVIEHDNSNLDWHVVTKEVTDEVEALITLAGRAADGTVVYSRDSIEENKMYVYFNPQAVRLPGVGALLERYGAKQCGEPQTEGMVVLVSLTWPSD